MSKVGIEQKSVKLLLGDNKADFLIPDYLANPADGYETQFYKND